MSIINTKPDTESQKRRAAAWLAEKVREEFAKQGGWAIPFAIKDNYTIEQVIQIGINFMYNRERKYFELPSHAGNFFLTHMLQYGVIEGEYVQHPSMVFGKQKEDEKAAKKVNPFIDAPEEILNARYNAILNPTSMVDGYQQTYSGVSQESFLNQPLDPWKIYAEFMLANGKDPGVKSSTRLTRKAKDADYHPSYVPASVFDNVKYNKE